MEQVIIKGKIMAINNLPYTNSLMPNMQAQTQQASMPGITGAGQFPTPAQPPNPTAQAPWIPPTYQPNPNQQFVGYGQKDTYNGQPIDPIRLAIGRAMQFDTSPVWAHNLPANAVPHPQAPMTPAPVAPSAENMASVMPPGMQYQPFNMGMGGTSNKPMIPRTGRKGPGYGTSSYQKGK